MAQGMILELLEAFSSHFSDRYISQDPTCSMYLRDEYNCKQNQSTKLVPVPKHPELFQAT